MNKFYFKRGLLQALPFLNFNTNNNHEIRIKYKKGVQFFVVEINVSTMTLLPNFVTKQT